jgi:hypothetical protein
MRGVERRGVDEASIIRESDYQACNSLGEVSCVKIGVSEMSRIPYFITNYEIERRDLILDGIQSFQS